MKYGYFEDTQREYVITRPDTPLPWNGGNSALASHRDTFFRPLRDVRLGDLVRLKTPAQHLEYRVRETFIVDPEDVWVLESTPATMLTLITCYPFDAVVIRLIWRLSRRWPEAMALTRTSAWQTRRRSTVHQEAGTAAPG